MPLYYHLFLLLPVSVFLFLTILVHTFFLFYSSLLSYHVMSCPVLFNPAWSCLVLTCHALSCPVLSCPVLSCTVLSCPVLLYPILCCPILSCPLLFSLLQFFRLCLQFSTSCWGLLHGIRCSYCHKGNLGSSNSRSQRRFTWRRHFYSAWVLFVLYTSVPWCDISL